MDMKKKSFNEILSIDEDDKKIIEMIEKNPELPIRKIKGLLAVKTGLKISTINTYINDLEEAGLIEWNEERQNYKILV